MKQLSRNVIISKRLDDSYTSVPCPVYLSPSDVKTYYVRQEIVTKSNKVFKKSLECSGFMFHRPRRSYSTTQRLYKTLDLNQSCGPLVFTHNSYISESNRFKTQIKSVTDQFAFGVQLHIKSNDIPEQLHKSFLELSLSSLTNFDTKKQESKPLRVTSVNLHFLKDSQK